MSSDIVNNERVLRLADFTLDSLQDGLLWVMPDGSIAKGNDAACQFFGLTRVALLKSNIADILPDYFDKSWDEYWGELKINRRHANTSVYRNAHGEDVHIEIRESYIEFESLECGMFIIRNITDQKKAEEQLQQTLTELKLSERESRFTHFSINRTADAIFWIDDEAVIRQANETACNRYGYTNDEFNGMSLYQLNKDITAEEFSTFFKRLKESGVVSFESIHTRKDGIKIPVEIGMNYIEFEGKDYTCSIVRDISERNDVEAAVKAITQETAGFTGELFFNKLALTVSQTSGFEMVVITQFLDEEVSRAKTLAIVKQGELAPNFEYEPEGPPCNKVISGEELFVANDLDTVFPSDDDRYKAYMGVPVINSHKKIQGHICCFNSKGVPEERISFLNILRIFASRAGAELDRMRAKERIRQAYFELEELEEKSRLSHFTVQKASDAVFWIRPDASIFQVNDAAAERYGYTKEELLELKVFDLTKNDDTEAWGKLFNDINKKKAYTFETTHFTKSGKEIPVEVNSNYIEYEGEQIHCTFVRDITQRKIAETNLRIALEEVENLRDRLAAENVYLQQEIKTNHNFEEIVSNSPRFIEILNSVEQVASTDATVLILGETGTGKELMARAIHNNSSRRDRPLVKINCASLPATLIESELFGHEKGAFTGAFEKKIGRFELAHKGTIFLDEIGEMPLELQAKMLRVLQEGEFERLGNPKTIKVDVRVIAATNRNLEEEIKQGNFRSDLYYRLNVFPIQVPALRERKEDVPLLARHFIKKHAPRIGHKVEKIPQDVLKKLQAYDWPGNIRELENIIERALIISPGAKLILGNWLPKDDNSSNIGDGSETLAENERNFIIATLDRTNWKVSGENGAAKLLDIKPTTLEARMKKLGIQRKM